MPAEAPEPAPTEAKPELKQPDVATVYAPKDSGGATIIAGQDGIVYNQPYDAD